MAGGKETPRQKMIGMMYLVLTALLALNVAKEVIAAFITINDKVDASGMLIHANSEGLYAQFDQKRAALKAKGGNLKTLELWQNKSIELKKETATAVSFLLGESNDMITEVEGEDWIKTKDDDGNIVELKSLMNIKAMDNYDVPTNFFIGGNPEKPKQRGLDIPKKIHEYRDAIAVKMATYKEKDKSYTFTPPTSIEGLQEALSTVNPEDSAKIREFYTSITLPEKLKLNDDGNIKEMPWPSVMFDHAPVVAAAAMFTTLKVDLKNAELIAAEFMLSKVNAPLFNFNKIDAMPFAKAGYMNLGDSMDLRVMIAAYDTNEVSIIKYGIDGDTIPENWKTTTGRINLTASSPGQHLVKGVIGITEKSETVYKPWEFSYSVGKPSGTISNPDMNVLYRNYDNKLVGAASGYQNYKLTGSGVSLTKSGEMYIAKPGAARTCSVSISGISADGTSASLGTYTYRVENVPKPNLYLGSIEESTKSTSSAISAQTRLFAKFPEGIPLDGSKYKVVSYSVEVSGMPGMVRGNGNVLNDAAKSRIRQARQGSVVTISTSVKYGSGPARRKIGTFIVK